MRRASGLFRCLALATCCVACDEPQVVELRYPDDAPYKQFVLDGRALDGELRVLFPDGVVESEGRFRRGVRVGPWVWRRPDGQLLTCGAFEDGLRSGEWEVRREDGTLAERGTWVRGARHGRFEIGGPGGAVTADAYWNEGGLQRVVPR